MQEDTSLLTSVSDWFISSGFTIAGIVLGVFFLRTFANRFIDAVIRRGMSKVVYTNPEEQEQRADTVISIFQNTLNVILWVLAAMIILSEVGVEIGPLIAAAGVAGVALGFGGQYLIRDVIAGFFIIAENQYSVGDIIEVGAVSGVVEEITLRMTTLRDLDGNVHHVPNGVPDVVSNKTKVFSRINMDIGIAYDTKLEHAIKVIDKVGLELSKDSEWADSIVEPPHFLRVDEFADSAIIVKILGETKPAKQWGVAGEFRKRLKIAFDKEKIEIPFPQQVNHESKK